MELNICHLYPDILNLYGDRGNIITMKRRLESRGISVTVDECSIGQPLDVNKYDIFFIGGGQDFEQEVLLRDLASGKGKDICTAVEEEKVFLAICGGYQMLGQYYKTWDGVQLDFIGAINVHTIGAKERMIGNYYSHGSLLPKNPVLCDFILQTALDRRYGKTEPLVPLNDTLELNAHNYMEQRLSK